MRPVRFRDIVKAARADADSIEKFTEARNALRKAQLYTTPSSISPHRIVPAETTEQPQPAKAYDHIEEGVFGTVSPFEEASEDLQRAKARLHRTATQYVVAQAEFDTAQAALEYIASTHMTIRND